MTDAFQDVLEDSSGNDSEVTTVTDTHTSTDFADDSVRSEFTTEDSNTGADRYEDPDSTNKADDVDPRKLFRDPTLNELRYYGEQGVYGPTVVEKPINDVFKHGFEIDGDNTERNSGDGEIKDFLDDYTPYYKQCEVKARRDGVAVLMFQFDDPADSAAEPIQTPSDSPNSNVNLQGFQIWTVDNLSDELADSTVAEHTDYKQDQIYVSEGEVNGGIVIVDDISHPDHGDIIGYGVEPRQESEDVQSVQFVHGDRCQHFVWNEYVDGNLGNNLTGKHIGESVLTSVLEPLKGAEMGYFALKNILFRYSAPLHAVEPPESWGQDDWDDALEKLDNLSMASDTVLPPGSSLSVAEGVSEFDPTSTYEVLVKSICAGTVFTKSVLQGTQSGTVSGSETDVKGYFNGVNNIRHQRTESKFREAVQLVSKYDQETVPRVADVTGFDINWGPLFKPSDIEQAEGMVSFVTAVTNGIKNYILTPEQAQGILQEGWARFDTDVDLEELDEDDYDMLDRINMNEAGQGRMDNEEGEMPRQNPQMKNGGGQPEGQTRESSQPDRSTTDSLDELSDEELLAELQRRQE